MSPRGRDVLGPRSTNTVEFDCLVVLPGRRLAAVVLHDACWSHRGRWHLTGQVCGLQVDVELLMRCGQVELVYRDKSSELVRWLHDETDPAAYRIEISHGRFSAYTNQSPRYPRGCGSDRREGAEISQATNRVARQLADSMDARASLRRAIADLVGDWMIDREDDRAGPILEKIDRLIDLDEKGLPLT